MSQHAWPSRNAAVWLITLPSPFPAPSSSSAGLYSTSYLLRLILFSVNTSPYLQRANFFIDLHDGDQNIAFFHKGFTFMLYKGAGSVSYRVRNPASLLVSGDVSTGRYVCVDGLNW